MPGSRFRRRSTPKIADTIDRLCYDGANRQPKFIVPTIQDALDLGLPVQGLALASALWCRYCTGTRDDGSDIVPNDPQWGALNEAALAARFEPNRWLDQRSIYGNVIGNTRFQTAFADALDRIYQQGVAETLRAFTESS
ncbi:mannitol dehydrogenase family protein [Sphingomonas sp. UYP23]